jgi:hypothetical protein
VRLQNSRLTIGGIDSDLLQYVGDTLGTHYAGDLLAFKDNWTFWADQEIKMLADSDEFDTPDVSPIGGDTGQTEHAFNTSGCDLGRGR